MKLKKRNKVTRQHGRKMGTHGGGARVKRKKSGSKGGVGMAGSGKRGDQIKTRITKLYGHGYFGKQGFTSKGTKREKENKINLQQLERNLESYGRKTSKGWEIDAKDYKILGTGEVKIKLIITAKAASKSAIEKVKRARGEIILPVKKEKKVEGKEKEKAKDNE